MLSQMVPYIMSQFKKFWPLPIGVVAGLAIWAGCQTGRMAPAVAPASAALATNTLQPGPDDPRIAYIAARLLENYHYSEHALDKDISARFYDGYIDSLDPHHEYFLQSDLAEFAPYRTNLDTLTVGPGPAANMAADLSPAFRIYERFQKRFQQRVAFADEMLEQDKFKFNTDEKIVDRRREPFPKDLDEARQLWRQQIRFEYLQNKLSREFSETNGVPTVKLPPGANTNIIAELEKHYRWSDHLMTNQDSDAVLQVYLNALSHAYDPHSDYMSFPHAQDFSISMNLSLFGIGAQLREDDGYCTIFSLVPGGPANKSKQIKEKDRIVAVSQGSKPPVDVVDMDLEKVVQQIRGPKGTEVRLTVCAAPDFTSRKVISLVRDEIKLEDGEAKAKIIDMPDDQGGRNRIGILELPSFYAPVDQSGKSTPKFASVDVAKLLKKMKQEHVAGVIVDLRYDPGGSLEEAIKFTGLFIKDGPVVQVRSFDGQTVVESCGDSEPVYSGPLVVMINRFSASAAEIAAAALQDYGRATIVGDISTHGKGTVQSLNSLKPWMINSTNDPGQMKITIKKFYRVSGASTQLRGVTPDIVLPDVLSYSTQLGESNQDNPLPWDTIPAASYTKVNLVQPFIAGLRALSDARVLTNQDFDYVRQDIEQYKKSEVDRVATLNEHDAIKEREQDVLKNHARDEERQKRPDPGIKIYELTVKNSTEPGLPPPENWLGMTNDVAEAKVQAAMKELGLNGATNGVPAIGKTVSPPYDPMLDETEHILEDYISYLQKSGSLTVNP
ncbi:MAG: carboxy terminal-processing peptidase [Verrucomicrobiota bacterium]|jgi:carboxyl-terminal processing protease